MLPSLYSSLKFIMFDNKYLIFVILSLSSMSLVFLIEVDFDFDFKVFNLKIKNWFMGIELS